MALIILSETSHWLTRFVTGVEDTTTPQKIAKTSRRANASNQQKERGNTVIKEEDCIEETDKDYQSDNESIADVGFVAAEGIAREETSLACVVDWVNYSSFTDNTMF